MNNEKKPALSKAEGLIPDLRFPEFKNEGEWAKKELDEIAFSESSSIALNKLELKSIGYPVYGADSIVGYIDDFQQNEKYISIVKDGSGVGRLNLCQSHSSILGTLARIKSNNQKLYHLDWIYYLLNTIDFSIYVKGAGIPHIYFSDFKKENVPVPSPLEQQKIASCLSSLDEVIAAHSQKLELLKDHKKGLMQNLFPSPSAGSGKGEKVPKYRFKEFEKDGEWEEKILFDVAYYENGKAHEQDISESGDFIVVNSKFISTNGETAKYSNVAFCLANIGDILMVLSDIPNGKAIAKCFFVKEENKYTVNQRICKVTPFDCDNMFLYYTMNRNPYFLAFDDGVKQTNLRNEDVQRFPFLIPDNPKEQEKIADCLSSLDALITAQAEKIEQLKLHKKGLMQGLFPKINK